MAAVDIFAEDMVRFVNAGDDLGMASFFIDLAAACGALNVLVVRDPYFVRQNELCIEYRLVSLLCGSGRCV